VHNHPGGDCATTLIFCFVNPRLTAALDAFEVSSAPA